MSMSAKVIYIEVNEALNNALQLLRTYNMDQIPVTRNRKLIGMIDRKSLTNGALYAASSIQEVMTKEFVKLSTNNTLKEAKEIFDLEIFQWIPIVDHNNTLIGIVTPEQVYDQEILENHKLGRAFNARAIFL